MNEIAILLVDDHQIFRDGLHSLFIGVKEIRVMDVAGNGEEALKKYEDIRPDVVVLDISLPDVSGFEIVKRIREINPEAKILVLSMHENPDYVKRAIRLKVNGYLSKEETSRNLLIEAIKEVYQGKTYFSPKLNHLLATETDKNINTTEPDILSKREKEILELIIQGLSNAEIAQKLFLSQRTIETHKFNIMSKLNTKNSVELVKLVIQNNLLNL